MKIHPGHNIRTAKFGDSVVVSRGSSPFLWGGAFSVVYAGDFFLVNFGLVNEIEPEVRGVPISGVMADGTRVEQPRVECPKDDFDAEGRLWVALRVEVDDKGRFTAKKATVVTTKQIKSSGDEKVGLHPLALLTRGSELHQITHFHLRHAWVTPPQGPARHFFWSA